MPNGERYSNYERGFYDGMREAEKIVLNAQPAPQTRLEWRGMTRRVARLIRKERERRE